MEAVEDEGTPPPPPLEAEEREEEKEGEWAEEMPDEEAEEVKEPG